MLDYGYRSICCYATIRIGTKKVKGTTIKKKIWICNSCGKRDVSLVEYTGKTVPEQTRKIQERQQFVPDMDEEEDEGISDI